MICDVEVLKIQEVGDSLLLVCWAIGQFDFQTQ